MMNDPELEELFGDPADRAVVDLLRASRPAAPPLDPHFRNYLRAKLMTEARQSLPARASRSWFPFTLSPKSLALPMAAVAASFLVVLGFEIYIHNGQTEAQQVACVCTAIDHKTDVGTGEPIVIPFTGPVDKTAVAESVVMQPATSVSTHWVGQNLVIIPAHPLAANTAYSVSFKPLATPTPTPSSSPGVKLTPAPTPAPAPVVVHFTTVRPPVTPVVPPSFKSAGVNYGYDSRLADPGTILGAAWTPAGQVLATRPVGQLGPGSSPSAPASATASATPSGSFAPKATTDVWLMSSLGTPIRILVPGGSLAAAAPSGGLIAAWQTAQGSQANLGVWDLQGTPQATIATVDGVPDRAPVWIGEDRIAYVDQGRLHIVDLHGIQVSGLTLRVGPGRLAASATSPRLAVEAADGPVIVDLRAAASPISLPSGAAGFAWSSKGDLAFVVRQSANSDIKSANTDLYVAANGQSFQKVASSPDGQTWSDLSWSPDASSLLLATTATNGSGAGPSLVLVNRDGSSPTPFGPASKEFAAPQWSPSGDLVLFTRRDEAAGGRAFWTATTTPSTDSAANRALAEVAKFMSARISGDGTAAQAELDDAGAAAYQGGSSSLLGPGGVHFSRYYPVTVQPSASKPNAFVVGVRIFSAKNGVENSFFEEQLTLVPQGQRYLIDAVNASPTMALGHGPAVVSVEVVQTPPGQQVRVRFDSDLKPDSITRGTIQVKDSDGKVVEARVIFDPDNHLATLSVELRPGTYKLVVTTGVTDINKVPLAQEYDAPLVISR
jgi:dipeptidyl aminopeptidase/acylaminoacyl peptidase